MNNLLYTYRGRTKIGANYFFSFGGYWPIGGKIKFYEDEIVVSGLFVRKRIPYSKIKKLTWSIAGYVKIEHDAGGFSYIAFRVMGKNDPDLAMIYKILKSKGVKI